VRVDTALRKREKLRGQRLQMRAIKTVVPKCQMCGMFCGHARLYHACLALENYLQTRINLLVVALRFFPKREHYGHPDARTKSIRNSLNLVRGLSFRVRKGLVERFLTEEFRAAFF
jgi:hypothetical protein